MESSSSTVQVLTLMPWAFALLTQSLSPSSLPYSVSTPFTPSAKTWSGVLSDPRYWTVKPGATSARYLQTFMLKEMNMVFLGEK